MKTRKELKEKAKENVKKHYGLFLLICLISMTLSSEFLGSGFYMKARETVNNPELAVPEKYVDYVPDSLIEKIFGRQDGVFSKALNTIQSGQIYIKVIDAVSNIVNSRSIGINILIILSLIMFILFWFFVENVFKVISRRFFLEGRIYNRLSIQRFMYLKKIKKWHKVANTMFLVALYNALWSVTIIGGVIKRYSYYLVPYIIAENPDIDAKTAIKLSRKMMNGYKWNCFVIELSFIPWNILGIATFGFSEVIFSNAYKVATFTEFYCEIRKISKNQKLPNVELLNDRYLYEKAKKDIINLAYEDIIKDIKKKDNIKLPFGIRGIIAKYAGITTFSDDFRKKYEKEEIRKQKEKAYNSIIQGKEYPIRLFPIEISEKERMFERYNYLRWYSIPSIVLVFFTIAFFGWIWEVCIHLVLDGRFVNRGTMHGPWLPIYGAGCSLILMILYNFRKKPLKHFVYTILICGTIEYITSYVLETLYDGLKWWDYTGYFINLNGRICAEGLTLFGVGGMAVTYFVAPRIDNLVKCIDKKIVIAIATALVVLFSMDVIISNKKPNIGFGITDYGTQKIQVDYEDNSDNIISTCTNFSTCA